MVYAPTRKTPSEYMNTVADALEILGERGRVDVIALPPPHAEHLGSDAALLDRISKRVKAMAYGGGDISQGAGDAIAKKMQIENQLASTEMSMLPQLYRPNSADLKAEWPYVQFHPSAQIWFDAVSETPEGTLYDAFVVKNQSGSAYVQPVFKIFPNLDEYSLGDLFNQHPDNPQKWKHAGRSDDMINFLSTEISHPEKAEQRINAHPAVNEAIIVGTGRLKASPIIHLNDGATLDSLWGLIEEVNVDLPVIARIARHMILTVSEPFLRTAKGTIQKRATIGMYERQLDELYERDGSLEPTK